MINKSYAKAYCKDYKLIENYSEAYKEYKANGGTLAWNEFQKQYKEGNIE